MYSALKVNGRPLYELARAGQVVPRKPRPVVIRALTLLRFNGTECDVSLTCSKGTYVRVVAEDVGRELDCGACLSALRRTSVGAFSLSNGAVTLGELEHMTPEARFARLMPADTLVAGLPRCELDAVEARRLCQGQPVQCAAAHPGGLARIYGPDHEFLGVGEITDRGQIVPRRLTSRAVPVAGDFRSIS
jgi:tRNA pseudouridine55 synthase